MSDQKIKDILPDELVDGFDEWEVDIMEVEEDIFEEIEKEEEEDNLWHRLVTSNPDADGDWDYFFNERYFEK